jgi:lipopolysaccharide export system protein LptA
MAGAAVALNAQTNAPATPAPFAELTNNVASAVTNSAGATNLLFRAPTEISSDMLEFRLETREAIYFGNVRVIDPQMKLACEQLTVLVPEGGGRINRIVAETNVVIDAVDGDGKPIHATGQLAVYTYSVENSVTNEWIELTGRPQVQSAAIPFSEGEKVVWDRMKKTIRVVRPTMLIQPTEPKHTNAAPVSPKPPGEP